ncbi:hypothetical protein [Gallaecimonas sp. GXIMD4217]|uniref:hypothetical protein n=1 Tax=Gallaecimonas sp. GXIMD4217 TaxID=3131927 RepID=UPI00311B126B
MTLWTFLTVVCVFSIAAGILKSWLDRRAPEADPRLEQELATLRARVEALERIVTDSEFQLKKDFEKL